MAIKSYLKSTDLEIMNLIYVTNFSLCDKAIRLQQTRWFSFTILQDGCLLKTTTENKM